MCPNHSEIGVGSTADLSLRVSVAALVRVLFHAPENDRTLLALERTATVREIEGGTEVVVKAKPFGGGVRITDARALGEIVGGFQYDSERSRQEKDFRIHIRPDFWEKLKEVCAEQLDLSFDGILDPSPDRELAEEFEDALGMTIDRSLYRLQSKGLIVEDLPTPTESVRAVGMPTVRIYYVYEAWLNAPKIIAAILAAGERYSDADLERIAREDARSGGRGRANAVLALDLDVLKAAYHSIPIDRRGGAILVEGHRLDANVSAILHEVEQTRYRRRGQ